ncbi:MAG TPA: circularly permuted type 2 ATP-grasp protein, partial [Propionibacteriaceae bacterium]|nr:circularly permuted type 2 ATP-grasp protein [Propionibacteriaceae bacterium]
MSPLFDDYAAAPGAFDEMFVDPASGEVREVYAQLEEILRGLPADEVRSRAEYLRRTYFDQGVTFDIGGLETPFPLDILPRILKASEWTRIEQGVAQRVRALERFLADVYGQGEVFADGVVPRQVVTSSPHFHRVVAGIEPANGVRVHVAGIDLVR